MQTNKSPARQATAIEALLADIFGGAKRSTATAWDVMHVYVEANGNAIGVMEFKHNGERFVQTRGGGLYVRELDPQIAECQSE